MNELAEKSAQEIQTTFGSSTTVGGDVSIPIKFITADLGGNLEKVETKSNGEKKKNENYFKVSQK